MGVDHALAPLLEGREHIGRPEGLGDEGRGHVSPIAHHVDDDAIGEEREHTIRGAGIGRGRVDPPCLALPPGLRIGPLPRGHDRLREVARGTGGVLGEGSDVLLAGGAHRRLVEATEEARARAGGLDAHVPVLPQRIHHLLRSRQARIGIGHASSRGDEAQFARVGGAQIVMPAEEAPGDRGAAAPRAAHEDGSVGHELPGHGRELTCACGWRAPRDGAQRGWRWDRPRSPRRPPARSRAPPRRRPRERSTRAVAGERAPVPWP